MAGDTTGPEGYKRLKALGPERFQKITNELARGTGAMTVARLIQQEWKEFQDVAEKTLTQQLNRFRMEMQRSSKHVEVQHLDENDRVVLKLIRGRNIDVLEELIALGKMQRSRVQGFYDKEQNMSGMPVPGMETAVENYRRTLIETQKVRFDLGADEFKGVIPGFKGGVQTVTHNADGSVTTRTQVFEAVNMAMGIMERNGIAEPKLINAPVPTRES